ncbi:pyrroline-5-carboxylate reductase family protein [Amylolactobacillus amylophilus]|nr:pyrroline-5-carboxylate reductase dimerization domain-containing protein [Amylolactobacillus amylophilus]
MIPNIPVSVNQGVLAVDSTVDQASEDTPVMELLRGLGQIVRVEADLLDVVSAGGGSAPAFAAIFVEALADSMVLHGLGRKVAYQVAEQMLRGTASLLLDRQILPAQLKDLVASPGGSTIRGVNALEQHGFRAAVMEAITKTIA